MDLTTSIRREFERKVQQYAKSKGLPVVFENVSVPQPAGDYLETYLLPTDNSIGALNAVKHNGLFQVNIYTQQSKGAATADRIAAEVMALFPRGARFGVVALGKHPSRSKGSTISDRYVVTVTADYFAIE